MKRWPTEPVAPRTPHFFFGGGGGGGDVDVDEGWKELEGPTGAVDGWARERVAMVLGRRDCVALRVA